MLPDFIKRLPSGVESSVQPFPEVSLAAREIRLIGDPVLRERCNKITKRDKGLQKLVDDMIETMHAAHGLGLAAPQVGVPLRLFIVQLPEDTEDEPQAGKLFVFYNPEIVKASGESSPEEGCLSIPGYVANVRRAYEVTIKGKGRDGRDQRVKATGLLAQVFQHEVDHLDGILFIDRLSGLDELRKIEPKETEPVAAG